MKQRDGVVMLLALLCILAIEVVAVSLHFTTMQEMRTSHSSSRLLSLRIAAQSAVNATLADWPTRQLADLPVHSSVDVTSAIAGLAALDDGIGRSVVVERLAPSAFLIRGAATSRFGETSRIGAFIVTTTALAFARSINAALTVRGDVVLATGSRIDAAAPACSTTAYDPTRGPPTTSSAMHVLAPGAITASDGVVTGEALRDSSSLMVGTLTPVRLRDIARRQVDSADRPIRLSSGGQVAPTDPSGVLVIDGDAQLDGVAFEGIVVVIGSLLLRGGASIRGALFVDGTATIEDASITFDRCALEAVAANPRLLGPYRPHSRMWIPLFQAPQ
jgi:hypothetical protein